MLYSFDALISENEIAKSKVDFIARAVAQRIDAPMAHGEAHRPPMLGVQMNLVWRKLAWDRARKLPSLRIR